MTNFRIFQFSVTLMLLITACKVKEEQVCDCEKLRIPVFSNEVQGAGATLLKGINIESNYLFSKCID